MIFLGALAAALIAVLGFSLISGRSRRSENQIHRQPERKPVPEKLRVQDWHSDFPSRGSRPIAADQRVNKWVGWNFCARLDVVGTQYRKDDALFAYRNSVSGDEVELIRDPNNAHDQHAIAVWMCSRHVGFIDKDTAKAASEILPLEMPIRGRYVDGWHGDTGFLRLTILPLMPDVKSRRANNWNVPSRTG